ncbi:AbrB family transcriptional regulator [Sporosarcina sp. Marseille-Q4063]|nr:AbrB family transcriptional regulator [Sporosarcina sp. Marseille-Q4063]
MNEEQVETRTQSRRITQIGNSLGLTLSSEMLNYLKVSKGDDVQVEMRKDELVIKKIKAVEYPVGISEDFFDVLNETVEMYDATLKELKDR